MKKTKFFESMGSMLIIHYKDEMMNALENGGRLVLGFAKEGTDIEREETWTLRVGKYTCDDKVFDNLHDFEVYMNGDECVKIDVYDNEIKVCGMFLA